MQNCVGRNGGMALARILLQTMLVLLAATAQPAAAGPGRDAQSLQLYAQAQRQRPDGMQRQPERDFRRAERPPERDPRRDGRLTEEERRDLRRDIDRANREIYKGQR
jgi:hypothetical protein